MVKEYTDRFKGFQFREPVYLYRNDAIDPNRYDLVKWVKCDDDLKIWNTETNSIKVIDEYCYTVAEVYWDYDEKEFKFESCGLRFLEDYVEGLNEWILAFIKLKELELMGEEKE